jgi:hypothetical protein
MELAIGGHLHALELVLERLALKWDVAQDDLDVFLRLIKEALDRPRIRVRKLRRLSIDGSELGSDRNWGQSFRRLRWLSVS